MVDSGNSQVISWIFLVNHGLDDSRNDWLIALCCFIMVEPRLFMMVPQAAGQNPTPAVATAARQGAKVSWATSPHPTCARGPGPDPGDPMDSADCMIRILEMMTHWCKMGKVMGSDGK